MKYKKLEKQEWILNYLEQKKNTPYCQINILDRYFVDAYIEKFNPKYTSQPYGADTVPEIGILLSYMYKCNLLNRYIIGLNKMESGFPKWVYTYELK